MAAQFRNLIIEGGGVKGIALIEEGIAGAERYFMWFENPDEAPVNRIDPDAYRRLLGLRLLLLCGHPFG